MVKGSRRSETTRTGAVPDFGDRPAAVVLLFERAALDRWGRGDPSGFLETCAPDVTYFDPFVERRIDCPDAPSPTGA